MNRILSTFFFGSAVLGLMVALFGLVGLGLYNSGKMAERERIAQVTVERDNRLPHHTSVEQLAKHLDEAPAEAPRQMSTGATVSLSGQNYLQSQSNPEKTVVYQQSGQTSGTSRQQKLSTYRSLQDTCNKWTQWYNKDRTANAAVNMNMACREASEYARTELGMNTRSPNRVDLKRLENRESDGGTAILVNGSPSGHESAYCRNLREELERIQSRLRAGYREPEGQRLRDRRRDIWELQAMHCR